MTAPFLGAAGRGAWDGRVEWTGAQRAVLAGDLNGYVDLEPLATRPHLYGLGPLEGVRGEVTIVNGSPSITTIVDGQVRVERAFRGRACFLVHAEVPAWRNIPVAYEITDEATLEATLRQCVVAFGLPVDQPLPFLITGRARRLQLHVLDKRDGLPHNPQRHEEAKVRFDVHEVGVEIIGFHSDEHRGVFTPPHSTLHMHVRTTDGWLSGHVDAVHLAAESTVGVPAAVTRRTS